MIVYRDELSSGIRVSADLLLSDVGLVTDVLRRDCLVPNPSLSYSRQSPRREFLFL
jgi:hypothetical protein